MLICTSQEKWVSGDHDSRLSKSDMILLSTSDPHLPILIPPTIPRWGFICVCVFRKRGGIIRARSRVGQLSLGPDLASYYWGRRSVSVVFFSDVFRWLSQDTALVMRNG